MGKRYIDADAFFNLINTLYFKDNPYPDAQSYNQAISDVLDNLTHFPSADVVEIVRCEKCKHSYLLGGLGLCCNVGDLYSEYPLVKKDHYCRKGDRKDG